MEKCQVSGFCRGTLEWPSLNWSLVVDIFLDLHYNVDSISDVDHRQQFSFRLLVAFLVFIVGRFFLIVGRASSFSDLDDGSVIFYLPRVGRLLCSPIACNAKLGFAIQCPHSGLSRSMSLDGQFVVSSPGVSRSKVVDPGPT